MDTHSVVQKMRPSSFSEEERRRYQAEKMMLRQFMLMKQQDHIPDYLSVRDMKTRLLRGRSFLTEFAEEIAKTGINLLFTNELAWTTARHFCLNQMEQELKEELDKEKQLSQLFHRKVTLQGLEMFVSDIRPEAEEDVQTFLPSLHSKLLRIFGGIQTTIAPHSSGDAKPTELMELERRTAPLVKQVVDTALRFFLEEPEREDKSQAAIAEIGKLLTNSAAPCLLKFGSISMTLLLGMCTTGAKFMVKAIHKRIVNQSQSFHQMDYDESFFSAREGVISAIQDMGHKVQTVEYSQAQPHLSSSKQLDQGLVEKREASAPVTATEELQEQLLEKREASPQVTATEELQEQLLEKREASPQVTATEELQEQLLEKREASPQVTATEELQEQLLEKREASPQVTATEELQEQLLEKREASPQVTATEELQEQLLEKREASPEVPLDKKATTVQTTATEGTSLARLETNVIVYMNGELEVLQQEEGEASEPEKSLVQDCVVKKKGVRAFFRGLWKMMTCCVSVSAED